METVGNWIFHEWWSKRHDSAEVVFTWLRTHTQKDKIPFTVVALADGTPVGSCSVIENDCVFRKQYTPWVAAVFVKPEMRHRGIASAVLQEAAAIAVRARVKGLYIDCLAIKRTRLRKEWLAGLRAGSRRQGFGGYAPYD